MFEIQGSLINGLSLGIEHISMDEDEAPSWGIAIHLLVFRLLILKYHVD